MGVYKHTRSGTVVSVPDGSPSDESMARDGLWQAVNPDGNPTGEQTGTPGGGDAVPDGTIAEVLDWVGDDLDRARVALDAEQAAKKPRTTLVGALTELLDAEPDGED